MTNLKHGYIAFMKMRYLAVDYVSYAPLMSPPVKVTPVAAIQLLASWQTAAYLGNTAAFAEMRAARMAVNRVLRERRF